MTFKEWLELQEVGTGTGSIAGFSRMTIPLVRRQFMPHWGEGDPFFSSKKKKKKEILKEDDYLTSPSCFPELTSSILS